MKDSTTVKQGKATTIQNRAGNASQKNERYWTDGRNTALSCAITRLMEILQYWLILWLYSSEQYSVHRFSICRSSVRHFPERSWTGAAFPCFAVVKSFMSWYSPLTVILPQIFFNFTALFSYPLFFCLFHAPLDVTGQNVTKFRGSPLFQGKYNIKIIINST